MWIAHLTDDLYSPSRTDYYIMRLTAEVRRLYNQKAGIKDPVQIDDLIIKDKRKKVKPVITEEEIKMRTAVAKASWIKRFGKKKKNGNDS